MPRKSTTPPPAEPENVHSAAAAPAEPPTRKKYGPDNLKDHLKKLPEGTRESQARAEFGQGYTPEEFREVWLDVIKAEPWRQNGAAKKDAETE